VSAIIPRSREEWRLPHDGAFLLAVSLGAGTLAKFVAPLLSGGAVVVGFLFGVVALAGHRLGYVPTTLLVGAVGIAIVLMLAFVAFVLLWVTGLGALL
jgi:hypothetical protein